MLSSLSSTISTRFGAVCAPFWACLSNWSAMIAALYWCRLRGRAAASGLFERRREAAPLISVPPSSARGLTIGNFCRENAADAGVPKIGTDAPIRKGPSPGNGDVSDWYRPRRHQNRGGG